MFECFELVVQLPELVVVEVGQRVDVVAGDDLVEPLLEIGVECAGREQLRQPADAGRARAVREDLGQLLDERGQLAGLAAVAAALPLDADDVEAALHEPAQVRQPGLDLLALGPHRADVVHREATRDHRDSPDRGCGRVRTPRAAP